MKLLLILAKTFTAVSFIALIVVVVLPELSTRPEEAERILEQSGYKDIEITGWRPFAMATDETFSTGFRATSPSGHKVTGTVTSGFFKGSTIRLD